MSEPSAGHPIRVVVVDDSPSICRLITAYLRSSPGFEVIGTALNGRAGLEMVKKLHPDVVTLDLEMPELNGLETLEQIMYDCPTPVVVVSGVSRQAAATTIQAINHGAVDFVLKYTPGVDMDADALRQEIIAKVRTASQIKVIRSLRVASAQKAAAPDLHARAESGRAESGRGETAQATPASPAARATSSFVGGGVIVIGASTGGPVALRELLSGLPASFPAALIIIQHMPASFTGVLAAQLDQRISLKVKEAASGDRLAAGLVLVAPGGYHLLLRPDSRVELVPGAEVGGHRPSIDVTMQSVAQIYGARTRGVLLTGMGSDGALGMVAIHAKGGQTYAQDADSCVINGMPQRAIDKGVVDYIAPPTQIAQLLRLAYSSRMKDKS